MRIMRRWPTMVMVVDRMAIQTTPAARGVSSQPLLNHSSQQPNNRAALRKMISG
jgi:hypothetical protein